jgi:hypothetical protein
LSRLLMLYLCVPTDKHFLDPQVSEVANLPSHPTTGPFPRQLCLF